jgi:2-hydroxychromene-2-carboxylate isomerase
MRPLAVLASAIIFLSMPSVLTGEPQLSDVSFLDDAQMQVAREIMAGRHCPCGCGRYLPGSASQPACFGCSVGKSDVTRILEGLAAGRERIDIAFELGQPVLVDVFADYTDDKLPDTWERASRVARSFNQHRVVLRTPGDTRAAQRAVRLAECARVHGRFTVVQRALIRHEGPWDVETLADIASGYGLDADEVRRCLRDLDVTAQLGKDREHAELRGIRSFPAVSVNGEFVADSEDALRRLIETILRDGSI